jgi:hypothetical protein
VNICRKNDSLKKKFTFKPKAAIKKSVMKKQTDPILYLTKRNISNLIGDSGGHDYVSKKEKIVKSSSLFYCKS